MRRTDSIASAPERQIALIQFHKLGPLVLVLVDLAGNCTQCPDSILDRVGARRLSLRLGHDPWILSRRFSMRVFDRPAFTDPHECNRVINAVRPVIRWMREIPVLGKYLLLAVENSRSEQ